MLGMSCFDVVNCIAWIFSTAPIPVYDENGERNNIYGATGSNGTCVAQGFFLQLGVTSIFFNISLSIHYFLVIVKGWKARRLQSARVWLLLPPIVAGFSLSFGGLPLYINVIYGCYIPPKPLASEQWPSLLFFGIPVLVSLVVTSSMMGLVYWKVRQQVRAWITLSHWLSTDMSMKVEGSSSSRAFFVTESSEHEVEVQPYWFHSKQVSTR